MGAGSLRSSNTQISTYNQLSFFCGDSKPSNTTVLDSVCSLEAEIGSAPNTFSVSFVLGPQRSTVSPGS